jgi:ankyrin repeat protein
MSELSKSQKVALHDAYKRGDLEAVRAALGDPDDFPNCPGPMGMGPIILEYAIYWSPLPFIRAVLELGADPNYASLGGFPSLIATLSTGRLERIEILELLLAHGADVQQRSLNGYTPLHYAASLNDCQAIELLAARGADLEARTNVDDFTTPLEEAELLGRVEAARLLQKLSQRPAKR